MEESNESKKGMTAARTLPSPAPDSPLRVCRRCLLEDMEEQKPMALLIREYIDSLPEEQRAEEALRRERLERCRRCGHLTSGTCGLCGCFVEARAAKAGLHCPDVPSRW